MCSLVPGKARTAQSYIRVGCVFQRKTIVLRGVVRFEHHVCDEIDMQGIGAAENMFLAAMCQNNTLLYIILNEEGARKV